MRAPELGARELVARAYGFLGPFDPRLEELPWWQFDVMLIRAGWGGQVQ